MKHFSYPIFVLFLILFSCNNEIIDSLDNNNVDDPSTRAVYFPTISGPAIVTEGESAYYHVYDTPFSISVSWIGYNAKLESAVVDVARFKFDKAGEATVRAFITDLRTSASYTAIMPVTVREKDKGDDKEKDDLNFLSNLNIEGPTSVITGRQAKYSLSSSSIGYTLKEINWLINDKLVSQESLLAYIFNERGWYTIKCSGMFMKEDRMVSFSKEIRIRAELPLIIDPDATNISLSLGKSAYYDIPDGYMIDTALAVGCFLGLNVIMESPYRIKLHLVEDHYIPNESTNVIIDAYKNSNGVKVTKQFKIHINILR